MQIEQCRLRKIRPYEHEQRVHDAAVDAVAASIRTRSVAQGLSPAQAKASRTWPQPREGSHQQLGREHATEHDLLSLPWAGAGICWELIDSSE
jgi:hypothetical protein